MSVAIDRMTFLDFEKPIAELESKIEELRRLSDDTNVNIEEEVGKLQSKVDRLLKTTYSRLTASQKVQVARHPNRPHTRHYIESLIGDFTPLAGDRLFGEDEAIIAGLGRFRGRSVLVIGHEKGHDTESRLRHNFGMAKPEGYRKGQRLMQLADRFRLPILTFVDTAGAYPGIGAEERGQAEAIAKSMETCVRLRVPIIATVIGEGGSGGAVAIATADKVLMMEHAIYSVISPEGCASILWRSGDHAQEAASALRLTAQDLQKFDVIDDIIGEPYGGAHRVPDEAMNRAGDAIERCLKQLESLDGNTIRNRRRQKYLLMGQETVN